MKSAALPIAAAAALLFAAPKASARAVPASASRTYSESTGESVQTLDYFAPQDVQYYPVFSPDPAPVDSSPMAPYHGDFEAPAPYLIPGYGPESEPWSWGETPRDFMQPTASTAPSIPASAPVPVAPAPVDNGAANLVAFLQLIRTGESRGDYQVTVGGGRFESFDDHPFETGEFKGIRRKDGRLTTAAGAYQIVVTTWRDIGGKKRFGNFSPAAQDEAAIFLIKRRKAYEDVLAGRFGTAIYKLRNEWEFIVTPQWPAERLAKVYTDAGGFIA